MIRHLFTLLCLFAAFLPAAADEGCIEFTYDVNHEYYTESFGTGTAGRYDVAIRLVDPSLTGKRVTGMSVPFKVRSSSYSEPVVWISNTLGERPDIASVEPTIGDNKIRAEFAEPVTIPEDGLYVGYSFSIGSLGTQAARGPIEVVAGRNPNGLFARMDPDLPVWQAVSEEYGVVSAMVVYIEGRFDNQGVGVDMGSYFVAPDTETTATATLYNHTTEAASSIDYTLTIGDSSSTTHLAVNLPGSYGATATFSIPLPRLPEGSYPYILSIDKVNGQPNTADDLSIRGTYAIVNQTRMVRPLVEEYTGLWCQFCPSGYVAMEEMGEKYGDDFIGVAYHSGDEMAAPLAFPDNITSYPSCVIDRRYLLSPGSLETFWSDYLYKPSPGAIDVKAEWAVEGETLRATSTTSFDMALYNNRLRVAYILVADSLTDSSWYQMNGYAGQNGYEGKWWDIFTKGEGYVGGLVYNSIAILTGETFGEKGSLPAEIAAGERVAHSYEFNIHEAVSIYDGKWLVHDPDRLRVVAMLIDPDTHEVFDCCSSAYPVGQSGVGDFETDSSVVATKYYDLHGRRLSEPRPGELCIMRQEMANGEVAVRKIVR